MKVDAEDINAGVWSMLSMPTPLRQSINDILCRKQNKPFTPWLTLKGFTCTEHEKFPANWKITIEQWFEGEMRAEKQEL
jgi:hypothetical protein